MKKSIVASTAIVLILLSGIAICSALIPSNDSLSSNESQPSNKSAFSQVTALDNSVPPPPPPDGEPWPYPTWTPTPTLAPTQTPLEGQPQTIPEASTGKTSIGGTVAKLPAPSGMTPIAEDEVINIGGSEPRKTKMISGSQLWTLYNGAWTKNSAAIYYGDWTYILLCNDQGQGISTLETYPGGWVDSRYWGYLNPGYKYFTFKGDAVGWHSIVAKGSATGQSNVIWVYVWSTGPTPPTPIPWPTPAPWPTPTLTPFTVTAWPSSSYYYIGNPVYLYYTVNKPCYARVTYLKQNSNIVWSGPYYVAAGTHTDTGTIGYPRGMRTVVVDAWTSSGEYDYAVTSYNVG
jgi:hypothetical protein